MSGTIGNIGGSGGSNSTQSDSEFLILCDVVGNNVTRFLRKYVTNSAGVTSSVDTYLDGTTSYTIAGTVKECLDAGFSIVLCDVIIPQCEVGNLVVDANWTLTGNVTQATSTFTFNATNQLPNGVIEQTISGLTPTATYQLDFVANEIDGGGSGIAKVTVEVFDDGNNLVYTNLVDATSNPSISIPGLTNSTSFKVVFTDSTTDTTDIDLIVDNVSLTCTQASTVITNHQFLRSYCKDCNTSIFKDTELDGTTPYTHTGTVKLCEDVSQLELISECFVANVAELGQISVGDTILRLTNFNVKSSPISIDSIRYFNQTTGLFLTATPTLTNLKPCGLESYTESFVCAANVTLIKRTNSKTNTSQFFSSDGVIVPTPANYTNGSCATGEEDFFLETLCDDNGHFLRKYVRSSNGTITITDVGLDGTTLYTVTGTVKVCTTNQYFALMLCDVVAGNSVQFLRKYVIDFTGVMTIVDTELDGLTTYTTQGTVGSCNPVVRLCATCRG